MFLHDIRYKACWPNAGWTWELLDFDEKDPGSFEQYINWSKPIHRKESSGEWEDSLKDKYDSWKQYCQRFNGIIDRGQSVFVVQDSRSRLFIDPNWQGSITDHRTIEINLFKRIASILYPIPKLMCGMYTYGTLVVYPNSIEATIGERIGRQRISHFKNAYKVKFDESRAPTTVEFLEGTGGHGSSWARFAIRRPRSAAA